MNKTTRPDVRRAWLFNERRGAVTVHRYVTTLECVAVPYLDPDTKEYRGGGTAWHHIFECERHGDQRVWGCDDRSPSPSSFDVLDGGMS